MLGRPKSGTPVFIANSFGFSDAAYLDLEADGNEHKRENIDISFDGSAEQVSRNLNCPFSSTVSAALACVKSVLTKPTWPKLWAAIGYVFVRHHGAKSKEWERGRVGEGESYAKGVQNQP